MYASLKEAGNFVTVCGNVCHIDEVLSNSAQTVCTVPPLVTTYSATNYKISEVGLIKGTWTGSV